MKRAFLLLGTLMILMMAISSCAATKRDCQGNKHTRLKNGIYL